MSLHRYFKVSSKLPDPNGPLSQVVPSETIKAANKSISETVENTGTKRSRGTYQKFTAVQQAQVAKYAVENGNQAAIRVKNFQLRLRRTHLARGNQNIWLK